MIKFPGIFEHKTPQIELLVTICDREGEKKSHESKRV